MVDLIINRAMFPGRTVRFCTQHLKVFPFQRWVVDTFGVGDVTSAVGIRRSESQWRANLDEYEYRVGGTPITVWRPLIAWSEQDVIDIHHSHGVKPNPLYLRQSVRVGCWPCVYATKRDIRAVADETPWRIDEIRDLESRVHAMGTERYAARGETYESLGYERPTFFERCHRRMSIDEAVRWSRTSRGAKQYEMFPPEPGCLTWGLCSA
jgi:3'-phosphoadenosine 5'-phosphosulfate sulfotransferase (PAPS reductase)/FAD synthetase